VRSLARTREQQIYAGHLHTDETHRGLHEERSADMPAIRQKAVLALPMGALPPKLDWS
jgi:hypothetical protein